MPDRPCADQRPHPQHYRDEPGQSHDGAWCPGMPGRPPATSGADICQTTDAHGRPMCIRQFQQRPCTSCPDAPPPEVDVAAYVVEQHRRREWAAATADVADALAVHAHHYGVASPGELAGLIRQRADRIADRKLTPWADGAKQAAPRPDVDAAAPTGPGTSTGSPTAQKGAQAVDGPGWDRDDIRGLIGDLRRHSECSDWRVWAAGRNADQLEALLADFDAHRGALRRASGDRDQAMIELLAARDQLQHEQDQTALAHAQLAEQQRELDRLRAHAEAADNALADTRHQLDRQRAELEQIHAILGRHRITTLGAQGVLDLAGRLVDAQEEVKRLTDGVASYDRGWKQTIEAHRRMEDEVERARPVVEAARAWRERHGPQRHCGHCDTALTWKDEKCINCGFDDALLPLIAAVDQHQQQDR